MTCYFRHLQRVFISARIVVAGEIKQEIDRLIHGIVRIDYENCPAAWRDVKKRIAADEESFITILKEAWSERQY